MTLNPPFIITARLLPGLEIGDAFISITYSTLPGDDNRTRYRYTIDLPDGYKCDTYANDDLQSGCGGGNLQEGIVSLLSFLSAAGESYAYLLRTGRYGDNDELFPSEVRRWAYENADELSMLALQIEESETKLIEE